MTSLRTLSGGVIVFVSLLAISVAGQQRPATPTPTPQVNEDDVVKITTTLIQMDVTVTDRKGRIIRDLKPEEIEIYENGKKQTITNLSFISVEKATPEEINARKRSDNAEVPVPPATVRPEAVRRTVALVVDDLALSFESAYHVKRTLKRYVDEQMQDGDLVAIIRTGAGVGALQQFTSDRRMLYAAIDRVKWNPHGRGGISAFAPVEPTMMEQAAAMGNPAISEDDLEDERNANNSFEDFRASSFITGTLGALRFIVEGMSELPGRKSVVLFSDGFRLLERDRQGFSSSGVAMTAMDKLIETANRASVVFYSIDLRGLQYTGITAADNIVDTSTQSTQRIMSARSDELFQTQSGLHYLAKETGGFAVTNNNDLIGGMRRVIDSQSYYLIAYEPDGETFDAAKRRFNKLEVKVTRPDTIVRYRSGFFNIADENLAKAPKRKLTPDQQILTALTSPFSINDIRLSLNSLYGNDPKGGNYVRSLLHIDAETLKFVDAGNGNRKAEIVLLAVSYGDNGAPVDQVSKGYTIEINDRSYNILMKEGFVYNFTFPVKKPGGYQYRVALRDQLAGTVGSANQYIEVPNLKKSGLTLSGFVLQQHTKDQWQRLLSASTNEPVRATVFIDTALRKFRAGNILHFTYEIYNARTGASKMPDITTRFRLFRDRTLLLDSTETPFDPAGQHDIQRIKTAGAIELGSDMTPGDYILQVIVTDNLAKGKKRTASDFITFEVVDQAAGS